MLAAAVLLVGGCGGGDEEEAPAAKPKTAVAATVGDGGGGAPGARPAGGPAGAAGSAGTLFSYPKIEEVVPAGEAKGIRHLFEELDFVPDPSGDTNRDPFRSFVVPQAGLINPLAAASTVAQPVQKKCASTKAPNYSIKDLRLVGVMARGLSSWALFQDTGDFGHTIKRGDCVGSEGARIESIDREIVTYTIVPTQQPGQPPPMPETHSIALYPESTKMLEQAAAAAAEARAAKQAATPAEATAPAAPGGTTP